MELGRDILDQQVSDRRGRKMGRVDGIVLELRDGRAPRVARLVIGGPTLLRRISPALAAWAGRWRKRWGPRRRSELEVPWAQVLKVGIDVKVDLKVETTPAFTWERWVRDHIITRIPGA